MKASVGLISRTVGTAAWLDPDDWCPTRPRRPMPFPPFPIGGRDDWPCGTGPKPPKSPAIRIEKVFSLRGPNASFQAAAIVAGVIIDHTLEAEGSMLYFKPADAKEATQQLSKAMIGLLEDCGNVPISEIIRRLLKRLGLKWPKSPPIDPDWPPYLQNRFADTDLVLMKAIIVSFEDLAESVALTALAEVAAVGLENARRL